MGAPIAGADQRAYVVSGGDLYLKGLLPAVHPRSLHMVFLLRGADARGMVSVHAIKRKVSIFQPWCIYTISHAGLQGSCCSAWLLFGDVILALCGENGGPPACFGHPIKKWEQCKDISCWEAVTAISWRTV